MSNAIFGDAEFIDGQFVSQKVRQVVDAIREYEPTLEVQWLPPEVRGNRAAYRIIHNPPGGQPYIIMVVRKDEQFDSSVLQRLIVNDNRFNTATTLSEIEALEAAEKLIAKQKFDDLMEEANDIAAHTLRTPMNTYRINKDLVFKDGIPFNAANLKD